LAKAKEDQKDEVPSSAVVYRRRHSIDILICLPLLGCARPQEAKRGITTISLSIYQLIIIMSANNIYGGGGIGGVGGRGGRSAMASVDFYRRVPKDLTEVSSR